MRKLQRLRFREKKEKELEDKRDEIFNSYRPMVSQGKEWRAKITTTQAEAVKSDDQAVRPVDQAVRPAEPGTPPDFSSSIPITCDNELSSAPETEDDEQLVDYSSSPERIKLEDN